MSNVDLGDCDRSSGWACLCDNQALISQLNTCVATSCTNQTDQEAIYGAVAQLCANNGVTVTNSEQATFSATSGGSLTQITAAPSGWGPGGRFGENWDEWVSSCSGGLGGPPGGWKSGGGPGGGHGWGGGRGGGGPGGFGPWGTKASGVNCDAWTTWTAGWGPFSSWTGTWSGCSSTTNEPVPATVTTTVNGQVLTGTTFGIQAVATDSGAVAASHVSTRGGLAVFGAVAFGVFGAMVAL